MDCGFGKRMMASHNSVWIAEFSLICFGESTFCKGILEPRLGRRVVSVNQRMV